MSHLGSDMTNQPMTGLMVDIVRDNVFDFRKKKPIDQ